MRGLGKLELGDRKLKTDIFDEADNDAIGVPLDENVIGLLLIELVNVSD